MNTPDQPITHDQLSTLADSLAGTRQNVYRLCESMFGVKADDAVFDALKAKFGLIRCVECGLWTDNVASGFTETCEECAAEEESDDDDE